MTETPQPHPAHEPHSDRSAVLANALGIVGIILLIIIVIWGLFHLASLFGGGNETGAAAIELSTPSDIISGERLTLSWDYAPEESGAYALLYQCKEGLQFTFPTGDANVQIPCGAAFTLGGATSSATVLPLLAGTSTVSVPLTVIYIPSQEREGAPAQGSATVNVHPASGDHAPSSSSQGEHEMPSTPAKPATPTQHVPARPADLKVTLISLTADGYGNGVATFDVSNIGGSTSGTYYFTAQLPTAQPYTYSSPAQAPLAPGSHITSTLRFTQAAPGLFSTTVSGDGSPANNTAAQYLSTGYAAPQQYQPTYNYTAPTYSY